MASSTAACRRTRALAWPTSTSPGSLDPEHLRGRSAWPAPAQVAEGELRVRLGLIGRRRPALVAAVVDGDRATVTLAGPDAVEHPLELRAERLEPPRATSCRADELEAPLHWSVVAP